MTPAYTGKLRCQPGNYILMMELNYCYTAVYGVGEREKLGLAVTCTV